MPYKSSIILYTPFGCISFISIYLDQKPVLEIFTGKASVSYTVAQTEKPFQVFYVRVGPRVKGPFFEFNSKFIVDNFVDNSNSQSHLRL